MHKRLNSSNLPATANKIVSILKNHSKDDPVFTESLASDCEITKGQLSRVIKYMRRCALNDPKFIPYYPISCKKGYYLPSNINDFSQCYITLWSWAESVMTTISPMKTAMERNGINVEAMKKAVKESRDGNYLTDELEEANKDTSWFLDE